jgi:hypothetical protein
MQMPPVASDIADTAPSGKLLTSYDKEHLATYLRLLDAHGRRCGLARNRTNGAAS